MADIELTVERIRTAERSPSGMLRDLRSIHFLYGLASDQRTTGRAPVYSSVRRAWIHQPVAAPAASISQFRSLKKKPEPSAYARGSGLVVRLANCRRKLPRHCREQRSFVERYFFFRDVFLAVFFDAFALFLDFFAFLAMFPPCSCWLNANRDSRCMHPEYTIITKETPPA